MTGAVTPSSPAEDRLRRLDEINAELLRLSSVLMGVGFPLSSAATKIARLQAEGAGIRAELGLPPDPRYTDPPSSHYDFLWLIGVGVLIPGILLVAWLLARL